MRKLDEVAIVGAGLAGLSCALELQERGLPFTIFEASDAVGGRIRTDLVDGFLLDRGFQIFLTAYPEAGRVLDYAALDLRPFFPGALVRSRGRFYQLADPLRRPLHAINTVIAPLGTITDKLKIAALGTGALASLTSPAQSATTKEALKACGFSEEMLNTFLQPLLSGIFLESELETSASFFDFVFQMLARGDNTLPARGMQAIPEQLASKLPAEKIKLNTRIDSIKGKVLKLSCGDEIQCRSLVIATDEPQCRRFLGDNTPAAPRGQICVYFSAETAPIQEPILLLNGEGKGLINSFCVPSNVAHSYAPLGKALLSAALVGDLAIPDAELHASVCRQLKEWFGRQVDSWEHLRTYRIKNALPDQSPQAVSSAARSYDSKSGVYTCGDYKETASINGAMLSGRKAAEALIRDFSL